MQLNRREVLGGLGFGAASFGLPAIAHAKLPSDRNFVLIAQRGATDGLSTVIPFGDPAAQALRGPLLSGLDNGVKLDAMFRLHPALPGIGALYSDGEALFVHAVASSYRDRSHFDAQNIVDTGGLAAYARKDGWMNRALGLFRDEAPRAIALAPTVPPALRGEHPVASYAPSALPEASRDLIERVGILYADDAQLHALYASALQTRAGVGTLADGNARDAANIGTMAAKLMTGAVPSQLLMLETQGWDTHSQQQPRLKALFTNLDALVGALKMGLGAAWAKTVVLVVTEFGRTAAVNGTGGTDHGTASAAMLLGGAVKGGRVVADWPGLAPAKLYQGRDLAPTIAMEAMIAGAFAEQYRLDPEVAARTLYPDHSGLRPLSGLVRG